MTDPLTPDPGDPFAASAIAPETARFNAELEATLAAFPRPETIDPQITRAARREGRGLFPETGPLEGSAWRDPEGTPGRLRLSPPPSPPRGRVLHFHGGGWTFGAPDIEDPGCQRLAALAGVEVYSARYLLGPEHPWPAPADDAEAAALRLLEAADGPIVLKGESAGAHLAAVTLLRLAKRGEAHRVAGAVLTYGMYDLRMTPSMRNWGERFLVLSTPTVAWFAENLLGGHDPADPDASPLLAPLPDGLPPALFTVGTADPLIDDTLFMTARWRAAGGEAVLAVVPGGVHAFDAFDLAIAREAQDRAARFVQACFAG